MSNNKTFKTHPSVFSIAPIPYQNIERIERIERIEHKEIMENIEHIEHVGEIREIREVENIEIIRDIENIEIVCEMNGIKDIEDVEEYKKINKIKSQVYSIKSIYEYCCLDPFDYCCVKPFNFFKECFFYFISPCSFCFKNWIELNNLYLIRHSYLFRSDIYKIEDKLFRKYDNFTCCMIHYPEYRYIQEDEVLSQRQLLFNKCFYNTAKFLSCDYCICGNCPCFLPFWLFYYCRISTCCLCYDNFNEYDKTKRSFCYLCCE